MTSDKAVRAMQDRHAEEMAIENRRMQAERNKRKKKVTVDRLERVIRNAETREMRTFELRDNQKELKHELEISEDIDQEISDYIKFEQNKGKKLEQMRDKLRDAINQIQGDKMSTTKKTANHMATHTVSQE